MKIVRFATTKLPVDERASRAVLAEAVIDVIVTVFVPTMRTVPPTVETGGVNVNGAAVASRLKVYGLSGPTNAAAGRDAVFLHVHV